MKGIFKRKFFRKGSVTVEFILIIPAFVMLSLVVWQMAVAGLAVINTQAALRDAVRVAAVSNDPAKARQQAIQSFGNSSDYRLRDISVSIQGDKAVARATTEIDILFANLTPITYTRTAQAPILD